MLVFNNIQSLYPILWSIPFSLEINRIKLLKVCSCDSGSGEQHSITAMVYTGHCCPERFALMQMHDSLSMHIPLGSQES